MRFHEEIEKETGMSSTTIARVNKWLVNGKGGYKLMLKRLKKVNNIEVLLSSWEAPLHGRENIDKRIDDSLSYLRRIHETVLKAKSQGKEDLMDLCSSVVDELGLPPFAVNPLVARTFAANVAVKEGMNLFGELPQ